MTPTHHNNAARPMMFGLLIAIFLLAFTAPASHAEAYKYWSLWEGQSETWAASQTGAADMKLDNGSVIAAKYVETEATLTATDAPSQSAGFDTLCPDAQSAEAEAVNVAVVLDYGDPSLTPDSETTPETEVACVSVAEPATGATALSQAATVSASADGFISTINGYPSTETATTTETDTEASETDTEDSAGIPALTVILSFAVLVLIVVVAIVMVRRRNSSTD